MAVRKNYVPNPSFEVNLTGWTEYNPSTGTFSYRDTSQHTAGLASIRFDNQTNVADYGRYAQFTLPPGAYSVGAAVQMLANCDNACLVVRRAGDFTVYAEQHWDGSITKNIWSRKSDTFVLTETTIVQVVIGIGSYGSPTDGSARFDAVLLSDADSVYFDGDTPDTTSVTYAWSGTAHGSTSTATDAGTTTTPPTSGGGGTTPPPASTTSGWELVESNEFSSGTQIDKGRFYIKSGFKGTNQTGDYFENRVAVTGGNAVITPDGNNIGGFDSSRRPLIYGKWDVWAQWENPQKGYKPVIFLWPDSEVWADGEPDFVEMTNFAGTSFQIFIHNVKGSPQINQAFKTVTHDVSQMTKYTCEWRSDYIAVLVNDVEVFRTTDPAAIPVKPLHLVIQVDVGMPGSGNGVAVRDGYPAALTTPTKLKISQIDIYKVSTTGTPADPKVTQIQSVHTGLKDRYVRSDGGVKQLESDDKVTSEGQGYAAMDAVQNNDRAELDLVESFSKAKLERKNFGFSAADGADLMAWSYSNGGNVVLDQNFASDGDVDRAKALGWAWYRGWGQAYKDKAVLIINQLANIALRSWNGMYYLATDYWQKSPRDPVEINLSYQDPAAFRLFYRLTGDTRWLKAVDGYYDLYDKVALASTGDLATTKGLPPDWNGLDLTDGSVHKITNGVNGWTYDRAIKYSYDSFRVFPRMYWDWLFNGETRAKDRLGGAFKAFVISEWATYGKFGAEYEHNGTSIGSRYEKTMMTWAAYFALIAGDTNNTTAKAMKTAKLDNRYVADSVGGHWADGPDNTNRSYFSDFWVQFAEMTNAGLWKDWGNTGIIAAPGSIVISDSGTSTDSLAIGSRSSLVISDTGTSRDSVAFAREVFLQVSDVGGSQDQVGVSVAGSATSIQMFLDDLGTSNDSLSLSGMRVPVTIYDLSYSTDNLQLSSVDRSVRPVVSRLAEEIYGWMGPWKALDAKNEWALLRFIESIVRRLQPVSDLVRDDASGPGWSAAVDLDRAPAAYLGWLGQFVGVDPAGDLDEESQRIRIKESAGFKRGTVGALAGAARQTLTGTRTVQISERDTSPYHLTVTTFVTETPDPDKTGLALQAEKPAGLVLQYVVSTGATYGYLKATGLTYGELSDTYPTYKDMKLAVPT